ncbi:MAG: hypothetical protein FJ125_16800, partial [Deltaproteobacteria bacterium]|nr:hypothetical protein [Deltaproteobacteria bacterium]
MINGKRMYHGDFERPNTLSWFLTSNVPELSGDLTDRCVVVRIGPQQHGVDFISKVAEFLKQHRAALIRDIVSRLRQQPSCTIAPESRDRFPAWQDAVLARFANGNELARLVKERRPGVDADAGEASEVADALAELLKSKGHCPGCEHIFIPKRVAWELLREKLDTKTETAFGRKIKVVAQNAPLRHVNAEYKHPEWRHGLDWCPPLAMKRGSGKDQGRIRHLDNTPPPLLPGMPGIPGIVAASGERHSPLRPDARGRRGADARHPRVQWTPHDRPRGRRAVTLGALLCTLHRAGVRLRVEGPRLLYVGPRQTLTQALLTTLRARKPELLALLAGPVRGLPDPLRQE